MLSSKPLGRRKARKRLGGAAFALLAGALIPLGGCLDEGGEIKQSVGAPEGRPPASQADLRGDAEVWGKRYDSNPGEKAASIQYAAALRSLGQYSQAAAVMQTAAVKAPADMEILGAYGKALADAGELRQAADVLSRSYTPERPNWASMSVQGSIADQLGDHTGAQRYYQDALKLAPGEPEILNNLGLSYLLTKQLPLAEQTLRQASDSPGADARVRDNFALILSLEGKFSEAEQVQRRNRSAEAAARDVAAIRKMLAQPNAWRDIQTLEAKTRSAKSGEPEASESSGARVE